MIKFSCPKCKMILRKEMNCFICNNCNGKFLEKNNIPILLIDKMEPLSAEDISKSNQSCNQSE